MFCARPLSVDAVGVNLVIAVEIQQDKRLQGVPLIKGNLGTRLQPIAVVVHVRVSLRRIVVILFGAAVVPLLGAGGGCTPGVIQYRAHLETGIGIHVHEALVLDGEPALERHGIGRSLVYVEGSGTVCQLKALLQGELEVAGGKGAGHIGKKAMPGILELGLAGLVGVDEGIAHAQLDPKGCQHARQRVMFWDRQGNKTAKRMKFDLIANFYGKSADEKPRYCVLMGTYSPKTINEMEELGFHESPDTTPGYVDYVKDADEDDLQEFTKDGYVSEMMDILYGGEAFEKIQIEALELDVMDDEGNYPIRGVMMGDTFVSLNQSDPDSAVTFMLSSPYEFTEDKPWFNITVYQLKTLLKVPTLMAAIEKLQEIADERIWTFETLNMYFTK